MTAQSSAKFRAIRPLPLLVLGSVLAAVLWSYWTTLGEAAQRWAREPQYSHGYLVPVFALVLLWLRRGRLPSSWPPWTWWGAPVLALGIGMRLVGTYFHFVWFDPISLLPCLAGFCLLIGGWASLRWAWPAIAFLAFMIPLPHTVAVAMSGSLQRIATNASTVALQTLGLPALAEGNTILLDDAEIGVVEACSGLRMLVIFFALSTGVALVTQRPLWEKLLIVVSAVPIALIANVIRITATGVLTEIASSELAHAFFHDVAGWLMMPLALGMLWLELKMLDRLFVESTSIRPARSPGLPRLVGHSVRHAQAATRTGWPPKAVLLRPAGDP